MMHGPGSNQRHWGEDGGIPAGTLTPVPWERGGGAWFTQAPPEGGLGDLQEGEIRRVRVNVSVSIPVCQKVYLAVGVSVGGKGGSDAGMQSLCGWSKA